MAKGDHLCVRYPGFTHHAIDLGDGWVAEYGGKGSAFLSVRLVPLAAFAARGQVFVVQYPAGMALPAAEVVRRALSRIGERRYDLTENNCEHFATWCKAGHGRSLQAEGLKVVLVATVVAAGVAVLAN